ncbi:ATP-dependent DNA helicase [Halobacterium sp. CBA1126]|uniref:ATP-dependent DNA helicase n=1 Tax=Halobacterium sp. CBA1126 TaxID=2668074 RepID=UPI0012F7B42B|nr:ATP-dependent DNA helicase [Halobacterium sp. CBA1126]MUV60211.1 AAA family ATPase [Halobacterium sp. CBA1126]
MELNRLSEERRELYDPAVRNQLIIAGAGSGKTYTLVNTVAERIREGIIDPLADDQQVTIFTFTENAAEELVVRLSQQLERDEEILNEMYVGTIHGWCNQYLDQNANLANTKILDELERSQLIQRIYGLLELDDVYETDSFHRQIELFENDLGIYYNENITLDSQEIPEEIEPALRRYVDFIEEQRLIDFGSLIRRAIRTIRERKDDTQYHLFVDEYQDVNPAQVELFQALTDATGDGTVFAVGDPRQAIYQWRGGDINRILEFDEDFEDVEAYTITTNRRSRPGIVNFSNSIYRDMEFSSVDLGDMSAHETRIDNQVSVLGDTASQDHAKQVAEEIRRLHNSEDVPYEDMAVLMRSVTSSYGGELMDVLEEREIPFHSPNRNSGTEFVSDVVFSIIELVETVEDTHDRNFQTQQEQREVQERIQELCSTIQPYCGDVTTTDIHVAVADWFELLTEGGPEYDNEQYNFRQQFYDFCDKVGIEIEPENTALQEGFASVTQIMKSIEEVYRRRFQGRANVRSSPFTVFTRNLKWHLENRLERWAETGLGLQNRDAVTVSTVHAAKGLEWPVVFVPHLTKNRFPVRNQPHATSFSDDIAERYSTRTEDEKRLWYVAATRARDRLYFYARDDDRIGPFAYQSTLDSIDRVAEISNQLPQNLSEIDSPEDDPEYIHTGVSSFLLLLECPYHFHMRHSVGVNPPVGKQFGAGNVLHRTIERAVDDEEAGLEEITREEVYLPLADYGDEMRMQNAIRANVENLIESGGIEGVNFSETPFTIQIENLVVSGIVDAIQESNGQKGVVDWKSSVHEEFSQRYQNQIQLYALALRRLGTDVQTGLIADLSKDNPTEEGIPVDVSTDSTTELLREASERMQNLKQRGPYTTPSERSCSICDISDVCPDSEVNET